MGWVLVLCLAVGTPLPGLGQHSEPPSPISENGSGELVYHKDERGNRVPDFSYAGYMAGEQPIPDVPIRIVVPAQTGDDTRRIQAAINHVASLPANEQGLRGAVLLEKGRYEVGGHLTLSASGVVLRGSGMGKNGTVLVGTGQTRETLIRVAGVDNRTLQPEVDVTDSYVPVGAMQFQVEENHGFKQGDRVQVRRPSIQKWIKKLGMYEHAGNKDWLGWKPGERDLTWDRTITEVDRSTITLDAPITTALDTAYGGGTVAAYSWPGRIQQVGIENIRLVSTYDKENPKDDSHRWMAVTMRNIEDGWVRQVVFEHFAGSAVFIRQTGSRITVEDSKSLNPVSEIGGERRYTFWTKGQQTLIQRLYAEHGYHDFAAGYLSTLNAFVECTSQRPHSFSGTIDSWSSGTLFDIVNVKGEALRMANRERDNRGAGWTGANNMIWQSRAAEIEMDTPPTAQNWAIGIWAQFFGNGYWGHVNDFAEPRSLYYAQLSDRLGDQVLERAHLLPISTEGYTSPTKEQAVRQTEEAMEPGPELDKWIDQAPERNPIPVSTAGIKRLKPSDVSEAKEHEPAPEVEIKNGRLVHNGKLLTGSRQTVRWWRGGMRPYDARAATPHVTRYVPGHHGAGLTDSLTKVVNWMDRNNVASLDHNYGLWYDRRRDDHQMVQRRDGDVEAPFYELPFARSGEGTAWDGLSKYDLTEYNPWYWNRLDRFADLAEREGILLFHQNYFQHNILEAGAHWADFPWRTANNINGTGFPEPPNYAGDKRIFMSKQFYNEDHPARRELHQAYIRKCLSNFTGNSNVIQLIGAEYTGPLHFTEFWIDTIQDWEQDTGNESFVGLSVTKDVQDAILTDREYAPTVDLIDIRRWHYREDGSLYAPKGGQFLAPRQHARLVETGSSSFEQVYRAVREYRRKYPKKPVTYSSEGEAEYGWAVFMAGGSLPRIPEIEVTGFLDAAVDLHLLEQSAPQQWILGNDAGQDFIIYNRSSESIQLEIDSPKEVEINWIDPGSGDLIKREQRTVQNQTLNLEDASDEDVVIWVDGSPEK